MCLGLQETGDKVPRADPMDPRRSSVGLQTHSTNGATTLCTDASPSTRRLPRGRGDERRRSHGSAAGCSRLRPHRPRRQGPCGSSRPGRSTSCGQSHCTAANTRCRKADGAEIRCDTHPWHPDWCRATGCAAGCAGEYAACHSQACQAHARDPGGCHTIFCTASHATCPHRQTSAGVRAKRSGSDPGNLGTRSRGGSGRQSANFTCLPAACGRGGRRHAGHDRIRCHCRSGSAGRHLDRPARGARADRCRTERWVGCARLRRDRSQPQSVDRGR